MTAEYKYSDATYAMKHYSPPYTGGKCFRAVAASMMFAHPHDLINKVLTQIDRNIRIGFANSVITAWLIEPIMEPDREV